MSAESVFKSLLDNPAVQVVIIQVVSNILKKGFGALDANPLPEKGKVIVSVVQVLLTLVATLLDAWLKGQAGSVDPAQWTQFFVMVLAVFGLQQQADEQLPKLHKLGKRLRLVK